MIKNESCLVCSHVLGDVETTAFVCHSSIGWAAGCSEKCLDEHDEEKFGMVHLGYVLSARCVDHSVGMLPKCFAADRKEQSWSERYFFEDCEPEEGDFIAPPIGFDLLNLDRKAELYVYVQDDFDHTIGSLNLVRVQLAEGADCIPFWRRKSDAAKFQEYISGNERCIKLTYQEIADIATVAEIRYLAADFLVRHFDYALLVPQR